MNFARAIAISLGLVIWTVLPVRAESPVNFSGTWELDKSRSVLPPRAFSAPAVEVTLVIDHRGETLKIERQLKMMGMHRSIKATYYTDGREASNLTARGETVISRSRWEGASLVTVHKGTVTLDGRRQTVETTDVRQLAEGGKVLVVESTVRRAGQDTPERAQLVFVRK